MQGLIELLTTLRGVEGIRAASIDPAELHTLPAVWVQLSGLDMPTLDLSLRMTVRVSLLVPDTGGMRDAQKLIDLFALLVPAVLVPDGPITFAAVTLPDKAPVPALQFPLDLTATVSTEE